MTTPADDSVEGERAAGDAPNALIASFQQVAKCGADALKQLGRELKVRCRVNA